MPRESSLQVQLIGIGISLSLLFLSTVCEGQARSSETFTSKEGGFSVKMPGEPKQESKEITSSNGPTTLHTFTVEENGGNIFYMVGYSDYQTKLGVAESLENVIKSQVESMKGTITLDKKTTLNGHPGRSVTIETEDTIFFSTIYVSGNRLYQVMYGMLKTEKLSNAGSEFSTSFKILI